ncbi:right-handed parallel beta-helix repeat-containing protein [Duganella sp. BJB1802]|uniref:right-handed parallel beta-helix repeat-containing protein n=1 Tax=Duganella sp. BJB1802 TaxID=2744575 RepID=UPI001C3CFBC8|nr:right-handed parallel beta-helix repeat-containing protein [Duganella sp. BJB1802]
MSRIDALSYKVFFAILFATSHGMAQANTIYYVDNSTGNDTNNGTSPSTAWKTVGKVSSATLSAGDSVLFNRGGEWRGSLTTTPGSAAGGKIVYGAYGAGNKPRLLGSIALNNPAYWVETSSGSHLWETQAVLVGSEQLLQTYSTYSAAFMSDPSTQKQYARLDKDYSNHSPNTSYSIKVAMDFASSANNVQIFKTIKQIVAGHYYKFSFNGRADQPVTLSVPTIISSSYASYATQVAPASAGPSLGTAWASYEFYFYASTTATDATVRLFLGNVPAGVNLNIDSFSVLEYDGLFKNDVGSLIFDDGASIVGFKKLDAASLAQSGDFWYDAARSKIRLFSVLNPGSAYSQLEAAVTQSIVNATSDVELRDLDLRYGGAHGVSFPRDTSRVLVDGLSLSYIGGGMLDKTTRYGNGIQFWETTNEAVVSNNTLSQIYDSGLTAQGRTSGVVNGITFSNNYISKAEQCYELWSSSANGVTSTMTNVTFTRNTCVDSGSGWSHAQRPILVGYDVMLYVNTGTTSNVKITDNIFYNAINGVVYLDLPWNGYQAIDFAGNCYFPKQSTDANLGKLLQLDVTSGNTGPATPVSTKSVAVFNSAFASNTSASTFGDPAMISSGSLLVPNPVGGCSGKGYVPPFGS